MVTMNFNGETAHKFGISSFNRNTTFSDGVMNSYAYATVIPGTGTASYLQTAGLSEITRIQLRDENDAIIYDVNNLHARLTSIDESLDGSVMHMSINLTVGV